MVDWDKEIWCEKKLFDIIGIWQSVKISSYRREERNFSLLKCNAPGTIEHKVLLHLVYFSNNDWHERYYDHEGTVEKSSISLESRNDISNEEQYLK